MLIDIHLYVHTNIYIPQTYINYINYNKYTYRRERVETIV